MGRSRDSSVERKHKSQGEPCARRWTQSQQQQQKLLLSKLRGARTWWTSCRPVREVVAASRRSARSRQDRATPASRRWRPLRLAGDPDVLLYDLSLGRRGPRFSLPSLVAEHLGGRDRSPHPRGERSQRLRVPTKRCLKSLPGGLVRHGHRSSRGRSGSSSGCRTSRTRSRCVRSRLLTALVENSSDST